MNKHTFSLSLAFGTAAATVGLMAVGAPTPVVMTAMPLAMGAMCLGGGALLSGKEQGFNGITYLAGTVLSLALGAMALEGASPGSVERYLPSQDVEEQIELSAVEFLP